ncbi:hypothetical protein HDU99_005285, partial [Rhizoclosmatium hyalinum]
MVKAYFEPVTMLPLLLAVVGAVSSAPQAVDEPGPSQQQSFLLSAANDVIRGSGSGIGALEERDSKEPIGIPPFVQTPYVRPEILYRTDHPESVAILSANLTVNPPSVSFYGGPILKNVVVQPLFYGNVSYAKELQNYYGAVTQSPWMDTLTQYGVGSGTALPPISVPTTMNQTVKGYLSDSDFVTQGQPGDIQNFLKDLVAKGIITPTANTYFPLHFAPGFKIASSTDSSGNLEVNCRSWCGYHSSVDISDMNVGAQFIVY